MYLVPKVSARIALGDCNGFHAGDIGDPLLIHVLMTVSRFGVGNDPQQFWDGHWHLSRPQDPGPSLGKSMVYQSLAPPPEGLGTNNSADPFRDRQGRH